MVSTLIYEDPAYNAYTNKVAAAIMVIMLLVMLVLIAASIVANWQVFKKLGLEPWACLIPFYNNYVLFECFYTSGWEFLTMAIPLYGIYRQIKLQIDIAHAFGKSDGFACGLIFLYPIFIMILAFDSKSQVAN